MVYLKKDYEINLMRESALLVSRTHAELAKVIRPGINSLFLDNLAEEFIRDNGGVPGFKGYNGFPNTLCVSQDNEVVHGIPSDHGAAVTVQSMVYGNLNAQSGSGVAVTRNPTSGEKELFGEYLPMSEV